MPFLSIIIPVYNADKYLKNCLDSIKRQTFSNYEVIIIDDGSKDKSPQICDEYAKADERFKVFHIENGGASRARNIGFNKAMGEYIYCIDNDDYIVEDDYFNRIYISLKEKPVDILQTGATYYRDATQKVNRKMDYINVPEIDIRKPYETIYWLISNKYYETSCWTKIINRQFLISNGLFFDETLVVEDLDWNMMFFQKIRTYNLLQSASYVHVFRAGSITAGCGEKGYKICLDQIYTIKKWVEFYEHNQEKPLLRKAVLSYLSYQYFITIGKASTLEDEWKIQIMRPLKEMGFISKYAIEKKQKLVSIFYNLFGFEYTSKLLKVYYNKLRTNAR